MKRKPGLARLAELFERRQPDRERWGKRESYGGEHWDSRGEQAAALLPDSVRVLEIGVGKGAFRDLVERRTDYVGADLNPLDDRTLPLDLDADPLPPGPFDWIVLLGVAEYLHRLPEVAAKLRAGADSLLVSYCAMPETGDPAAMAAARRAVGWVNDLSVPEFRALFAQDGFALREEQSYRHAGPHWDQRIYLFQRAVDSTR